MADFFNEWWGIWIAVLVMVSILGCGILLWSQSKVRVQSGSDGKPVSAQTTGHVWDEDLRENNNPLPRWWSGLFYLTILFGIVYLIVYPGLGSMRGVFGWSQAGEYDEEMKAGERQYGPIFNKYMAMEIPAVAKDPQARAIGERLFLNSCAQCHGSDGQGTRGFPNLTDKDWLYGGDPQAIVTSITGGRNGQMPPMGAAIGTEEDVRNVANFVLSLSGSQHDAVKAAAGKLKFTICAACHGPEGKGNQALGAPNLSDKIWLHGGSLATVMETINKGRNSVMPSHKNLLGEAKIHLLAAYVWGISNAPSASTGVAAAGTNPGEGLAKK